MKKSSDHRRQTSIDDRRASSRKFMHGQRATNHNDPRSWRATTVDRRWPSDRLRWRSTDEKRDAEFLGHQPASEATGVLDDDGADAVVFDPVEKLREARPILDRVRSRNAAS